MKKVKTRETIKGIKLLDKSVAKRMKDASIRMKNTATQSKTNDEQPTEYATNHVSDGAGKISRETAHRLNKHGENVMKLVKIRSQKPKTADQNKDVPAGVPKETEQERTGEKAKEYARAKTKDKERIRTREKTVQGHKTEIPTPKTMGKDKTISYYAEKTIKKPVRPTPKTPPTTAKGKPKYVKHTIKTDSVAVKTSAKKTRRTGKAIKSSTKTSRKAVKASRKTSQKAVKTSQKASQKAARAATQAVKTTVRATVATVKATAATIKSGYAIFAAGGWVILLILLIIILFAGILSLNTDNSSNTVSPVSEEVKAYEPLITQYAAKHGIPGYVELIKAVMMQESGGKGNDPMQASECGFNTKYPNSPNGITKSEYSIDVGIQNLAACLKAAEVKNPIDMDNIKTALQGYNYGNGYIAWAVENYGGYTSANAIEFSEMMKKKLGWGSYGDTEYVPHVLRYYPIGDMPMGIGNQAIVQIALTQEGNKGGKLYWSWYGFPSRVSWCACFVSWCADQCGLIESGVIPKFSLCSDGADWFKQKGQWREKGYVPSPGDIIFFDRDKSGTTHHVGIVENVSDGTVNTIEGNSGDVCRKRSYPLDNDTIYGYGIY